MALFPFLLATNIDPSAGFPETLPRVGNRNMEIKQAVVALTALAQESRLRVFRLLVPAGKRRFEIGC